MSTQLPEPRLTAVYRLEATLGEPLELGHTARPPTHRAPHRRDLHRCPHRARDTGPRRQRGLADDPPGRHRPR